MRPNESFEKARFPVCGVYWGKKWEDSDYGDTLHCQDLAYADLIVCEVNLSNALRAIKKHVPELVPGHVENVRWPGGKKP